MEENVKEKNNNGIINAILCILLLASIGFICYDKLLKKEESKSLDCNCPVCEKCNIVNNDEELRICTIDMKGRTSANIYTECSGDGMEIYGGHTKVIVKNIEINKKNFQLEHIFDGYENSITKMYINGQLLDVYKGDYRQILWGLKIKDNKLVVEESFPSDVPPGEHTYDLSELGEE